MLDQNYPNPFNPTTTISYALPSHANVTVRVFDMLGRQVAELVNESVSAGQHSVEFDASQHASGLYFYRLSADAEGKEFHADAKTHAREVGVKSSGLSIFRPAILSGVFLGRCILVCMLNDLEHDGRPP